MSKINQLYQLSGAGANKKRPRVAVGMSGGVDSSLAAHLLVEAGYDVTGVFLECWRAPGCRSEEDRQDALKVALSLDIPFQVLDFKQAYREKVVEYFFREYQAGRTPNPDVLCNKEIKFGLFYDWAMAEGFDFIATGHYAAKIEAENIGPCLAIPADAKKDQTYFMYLMTEDHLAHTLFPLAGLTKTQVRQEARKRKIHTAGKKDSVGICFIGDINVHEFLKERLGENPGEVVDTYGNVIGSHRGLWFYTIGQRSGFTICPVTDITNSSGETISRQNIPPFYVIGKDGQRNRLIVGFGQETYRDTFEVSELHLINNKDMELLKRPDLMVRIRHTGALIPCQVEWEQETKNENSHRLRVILAEPTKGIAEGQSAVFYLSEQNEAKHRETNSPAVVCLGGGVMAS
jgi:tRNA-specific 2-thiouridylase